MAHQHEINWAKTLDIYAVDTIDPSHQTVFVLRKMVEVGLAKFLQEKGHLRSRHRFHNEFLVV